MAQKHIWEASRHNLSLILGSSLKVNWAQVALAPRSYRFCDRWQTWKQECKLHWEIPATSKLGLFHELRWKAGQVGAGLKNWLGSHQSWAAIRSLALTGWLWASYLTSPSLSFATCHLQIPSTSEVMVRDCMKWAHRECSINGGNDDFVDCEDREDTGLSHTTALHLGWALAGIAKDQKHGAWTSREGNEANRTQNVSKAKLPQEEMALSEVDSPVSRERSLGWDVRDLQLNSASLPMKARVSLTPKLDAHPGTLFRRQKGSEVYTELSRSLIKSDQNRPHNGNHKYIQRPLCLKPQTIARPILKWGKIIHFPQPANIYR